MVHRAAEEVGPEECLPTGQAGLIFCLTTLTSIRLRQGRAFFDSFFGGQRKNDKLNKLLLNQQTRTKFLSFLLTWQKLNHI